MFDDIASLPSLADTKWTYRGVTDSGFRHLGKSVQEFYYAAVSRALMDVIDLHTRDPDSLHNALYTADADSPTVFNKDSREYKLFSVLYTYLTSPIAANYLRHRHQVLAKFGHPRFKDLKGVIKPVVEAECAVFGKDGWNRDTRGGPPRILALEAKVGGTADLLSNLVYTLTVHAGFPAVATPKKLDRFYAFMACVGQRRAKLRIATEMWCVGLDEAVERIRTDETTNGMDFAVSVYTEAVILARTYFSYRESIPIANYEPSPVLEEEAATVIHDLKTSGWVTAADTLLDVMFVASMAYLWQKASKLTVAAVAVGWAGTRMWPDPPHPSEYLRDLAPYLNQMDTSSAFKFMPKLHHPLVPEALELWSSSVTRFGGETGQLGCGICAVCGCTTAHNQFLTNYFRGADAVPIEIIPVDKGNGTSQVFVAQMRSTNHHEERVLVAVASSKKLARDRLVRDLYSHQAVGHFDGLAAVYSACCLLCIAHVEQGKDDEAAREWVRALLDGEDAPMKLPPCMSPEAFKGFEPFNVLRKRALPYYHSTTDREAAMRMCPKTFTADEVLGRTPRTGYAKNPDILEPAREVLKNLNRDDLLKYDMPTGSGPELPGAYCGNSDLQFELNSPRVMPSDCLLATHSDIHFDRNTRLGNKTSFRTKFREAKEALRMDKPAGLTSAYHRECLKSQDGVSAETKDEAFALWKVWGENALEEFTWLRLLAFAVAPMSVLLDSDLFLQSGVLCPLFANVKDEPAPYKKTMTADGSFNPTARFRSIKVQSLEDEVLCRILVTPQVNQEKRAVSLVTETARCPVLVGSGLEAGGRDLLCRHMVEVAKIGPQCAPDKVRAGAVGDDSLASAPVLDPPPPPAYG